MKYMIALSFCLLSLIGMSQELPDLSKYKHDVGFNTSIILNGILYSQSSPFDLMYKIQKGTNKAVRLGASIYVNSNTNTWSNTPNYDRSEYYSGSFTVGKEKQNQLSKMWIFYYGADLGVTYLYRKQQTFYNSNLAYYSMNTTMGGLASPFLGIRFQINEKLYIATEAALKIGYGRMSSTWKSYDSNGVLVSETKEGFNNIDFRAQPAASIFVFYRF